MRTGIVQAARTSGLVAVRLAVALVLVAAALAAARVLGLDRLGEPAPATPTTIYLDPFTERWANEPETVPGVQYQP